METHGRMEETHAGSKAMCKIGGNITRVQLPGKQSHFTTPGSAEPFYVKWIADRFAGMPASNGCSNI